MERGYIDNDNFLLNQGSLPSNNKEYSKINVNKNNNNNNKQAPIGNVFDDSRKKLEDTNWMQIFLACLCEFIGLTLIIVIGAGTAGITGSVGPTAFAFGMSMVLAMVVFGMFSGGHFNPGVSLSLWFFGHVSLLEALMYIIAQLAASFLGAVILLLLFGSGSANLDRAATVVDPTNSGDVSTGQALVVEIIGAMVFTMAVLRLTYFRVGIVLSALLLGFTFVGLEMFGLLFSGGSYNMFRSLGIGIISGEYSDLWVYVVAHLGGVVIACLVELLLRWMKNSVDNQTYDKRMMNTK